jgi:integrase
MWHQARTKIGRPDLHFHDLRHTGNTLAAATGASTKELMARYGHSSPRAALRYQHATRGRDAAIAQMLNRLIVQHRRATEAEVDDVGPELA